VRKEIEQEEQEEIKRLLQQGKNWFFHVAWFLMKKGTKADGLPSQAWHNEHVGCL
jgi:hypothetical protein